MVRSMVSHDFARGTIRGLPPGVREAVRTTGTLPHGAVHPHHLDTWNAVAAQRALEAVQPRAWSVADIGRMRWGFDPEAEREAWEVFAGKDAVPRRVPIENWKCACKVAGSANGSACGTYGGVVEGAGGWTYDATHDQCVAKGRCTRSWPI